MYSTYSSLYKYREPPSSSFVSDKKFLPFAEPVLHFPPSEPDFKEVNESESKFVHFDENKIWVGPRKEKTNEAVCKNDKCSGKQTCSAWKNDPSYWGPHLWYYIHYSTLNFPKNPTKQQSQKMYDWICNLTVTIPCEKCKGHYEKNINANRDQLKMACTNGDDIFNLMVDIHNEVNQRNGKPKMSYEEARKIYSQR